MAIASPTLFICVVSVGSACGMVAVRKHLEGEARNLGDDVIAMVAMDFPADAL
jgi:hypothetical protein